MKPLSKSKIEAVLKKLNERYQKVPQDPMQELLSRIQLMKGDKGDVGPRGEDGKTPKRGVDFFTKEDIIGFLRLVTPVKNKDYFDGDPGESGKDGVDGVDGIDGVANLNEVETLVEREMKLHEKVFNHLLIHDPKKLGDLELGEVGEGQILQRKGDKLVGMDLPNQPLRYMPSVHGGGSTTSISITTKTANFTASYDFSHYMVDASGGAITVTLPPVGDMANREIVIKKIDSSDNAITISGTLDGEASRVLIVQNQFYRIASDGLLYYII